MIWVSDRSICEAFTPSRPRIRIVLSPAIVPATPCEPGTVDALGEGRRRAGRGSDDQPGAARHERERELVEQVTQQRHRAVGPRLAAGDVPQAVLVVHAGQTEFLDVAADRGLRGVDTEVGEARADLLLGAQPLARDQADDRLLALGLHGGVVAAHTGLPCVWATRRRASTNVATA